ncbi:MAG: 23S rRNA (adenine(2030)-N(6))-methyltransferase RlmJ [Acetobacteraceae bacterium]|nr:23S rRNA (adenine(2030)-N(6))-methyltransferase RlmJ [Acetobacteraceae bacterium]MDW8397826.1 23S rRNA (adenine(2030)-N(6))-methyltransferase RlmJ [Acetobacteraceae bacterium]
MNYRHAFHAGNFADCVKHALLVALVSALCRKPAPFAVLDTHAGRGRYDLSAEAAGRTGEWRAGIGRLCGIGEGPLSPWLGLVRAAGFPPLYPGSPLLLRALLREQDRLILCEKHPEEAAALRAAMGRDRRVAVHERDGWEAIGALTPFAERRGLVLIDPPFEQPGEFARIAGAFRLLRRRFRAAVAAAWYPLKHRAPLREFEESLREAGLTDIVAAELTLREPTDPARLNGCGMVVMNPPFGFGGEAQAILDALLPRLAQQEPGAGAEVRVVADE